MAFQNSKSLLMCKLFVLECSTSKLHDVQEIMLSLFYCKSAVNPRLGVKVGELK